MYGCDRPIKLSYYEFGALYHDGVGIDPDVIAEMARRTGCVFEADERPRAQIWRELEAGTLDMTNSGIRTDRRRQFAYFIPYLGWKNVLVTTPEIARVAPDLDAMLAHPNWRIGVVKGFVHGPYYDFRLQPAIAAGRVSDYPNQDGLYEALKSGKVQIIISPAINFLFYMTAPGDQARFTLIDVTEVPVIPHNMIFAKARFTDAEINAWTRLFEVMRQDGTLAAIYRAHLPAATADAILNY